MLFTLEAVEAKQGDCLLLHVGTKQNPQLIVIDGGPAGVYTQRLSKRLAALKDARFPNTPMPIRMVMVSHIDDDHINGILEWFKRMDELRQAHQQVPFSIATLWHNSFDDILSNAADELMASFAASVKAASNGVELPPGLPLQQRSALVLANVPQGRNLRNCAKALGLTVNQGFKKAIMVPDGQAGKILSVTPDLNFTVLGPAETRLKDFQTLWDKEIKKLGLAKVADYIDDGVANLSSIIVLAEANGKSMLLTGDARGDDVIEGLKSAGRLNNGQCRLDLLKLPHHGSDRNVKLEFFQSVIADNYVCSGNGKYGNPETDTLQMILKARGTDPYTIYLTNREPRIEKFFQSDTRGGKHYKVVYRSESELSVRIDLGESL